MWPATADDLIRVQDELARTCPGSVPGPVRTVGGCFVCFDRERAFAAAAAGEETAVVTGVAGAPYEPGLLALREGPLLEAAVRALPEPPDVLLVNATGRDHPRRAGLALHLGAVLGLPTVGVTHRPLMASGEWDGPLLLEGEIVGYWVRTRRGARPLAVHAAWRTDPETAVEVVRAATGRARTPEPLRRARQAARSERARKPDMQLTSDAFADGRPIPRRHTCEGEDLSPPLEWSGLPEGTVSLALIVDDPDAPVGTFTHWLAWGIDPAAGRLGEGAPAPSEGRNDFGETGYRGPCPPGGHGPHRYFFRLHALESEVALTAGAGRRELERALEGRVLEVAELVGTYER